MTDKVHTSFGRVFRSREAATARQHGSTGTLPGWTVKSGMRLVEGSEGELATGPLNSFNHASTTGLDVAIDTGEAIVGGAYLARDTQTVITLPANSTTTISLGWKDGQPDVVLLGEDGTAVGDGFDPDDPTVKIWEFVTDGTTVTTATDLRHKGPTTPNTLVVPTLTDVPPFEVRPTGAQYYVVADETLYIENGVTP